MRTHPIFLRLEGRRCVVIGDHPAIAGRLRACLAAGASVVLVAEGAPPTTHRALTHVRRRYRPGDLAGAFVAYAASADHDEIEALRAEAERERVLLNVVDVPEASSFFSPAVVDRGDLQIAIGTGGDSPSVAARLRREIEATIGPEYAPYVTLLGALRRRLGRRPDRAAILGRLVDSELLGLVRGGDVRRIDALLRDAAGEGFTVADLGVSIARGAA